MMKFGPKMGNFVRGRLLFTCVVVYLSVITCCLCQKTTDKKTDTVNTAAGDAKCIVTEPQFNATFDLNGMRSSLGHIYSAPKEGDITFNMCGGMNPHACNGQDKVGACLRTPGNKEIILGYESGVAKLENSLIYFDFVGETCEGGKNYTMNILAKCSFSNEKDPISLVKVVDKCNYILSYNSRAACLKTSVKPRCQFDLPGNRTVNFGQLLGNNYAKTPDKKLQFIVSVCNPVIYGPSSACPPDTHVCVYDAEKKEYSNIGGPNITLLQQSTSTALNFSSNTACSIDPKRMMSSIISFKCDRSQVNRISYVDTVMCTHFFDWYTPVGCDIADPPCVAFDPSTQFKYDLMSLSSSSYNVSRNGSVYSFGVCKAASTCLETAGACSNGLSLGVLNTALQIDETGYPYLEYKNGPVCRNTLKESKPWYTKIEFKCADNKTAGAENNTAVIVEDTDCRLIIQFATDKACPPQQIQCSDGGEYDLTPLIRTTTNYEANVAAEVLKNVTDKNLKFYLNVCRPLVHQYGLSCQGGSSVCRANIVDGKPEKESSLGFPDVSLTVVNNSDGIHPQLKYLRGDPCPNSENATSTIDFKCNPKVGRGNPVLKKIEDDCHYEFEWETNVFCPSGAVDYDKKSCSVVNKETNGSFALTSVGTGGNLTLDKVTVNLCNLSSPNVTFDYYSEIVYLRFRESSVSAELTLECRGAKNETTQVKNSVEPYDWTVTHTCPEVCKFFGETVVDEVPLTTPAPPPGTTTTTTTTTTTSTVKPTGKSSDNSSTTSATTVVPPASNNGSTVAPVPDSHSGKDGAPVPPARSGMSAWGITGVLFLLCGIFAVAGFLLRSPQRRAQVMSLFRRKNTAVSYTRVSNEANLLLAPAGLSESDDELLV